MNAPQIYQNRREAGAFLVAHVREQLPDADDAVVLGLARGGVPVGLELARALNAILDVFIVRKIGMPDHEEYAIGAIAAGGYEVLNERVIEELGITKIQIAAIADREKAELLRREKLYRGNLPAVSVRGRTAILVDDGLATGLTMRAAIAAVLAQNPARVIVAVPVGAVETCDEIAHEVDALICPLQPEMFQAVGLWYRDFTPTTDREVRECLSIGRVKYETTHSAHATQH